MGCKLETSSASLETFCTVDLESLHHITEIQMSSKTQNFSSKVGVGSHKTEWDLLLPLVQSPWSLQIHNKLTGKTNLFSGSQDHIMDYIRVSHLKVVRTALNPSSSTSSLSGIGQTR